MRFGLSIDKGASTQDNSSYLYMYMYREVLLKCTLYRGSTSITSTWRCPEQNGPMIDHVGNIDITIESVVLRHGVLILQRYSDHTTKRIILWAFIDTDKTPLICSTHCLDNCQVLAVAWGLTLVSFKVPVASVHCKICGLHYLGESTGAEEPCELVWRF